MEAHKPELGNLRLGAGLGAGDVEVETARPLAAGRVWLGAVLDPADALGGGRSSGTAIVGAAMGGSAAEGIGLPGVPGEGRGSGVEVDGSDPVGATEGSGDGVAEAPGIAPGLARGLAISAGVSRWLRPHTIAPAVATIATVAATPTKRTSPGRVRAAVPGANVLEAATSEDAPSLSCIGKSARSADAASSSDSGEAGGFMRTVAMGRRMAGPDAWGERTARGSVVPPARSADGPPSTG